MEFPIDIIEKMPSVIKTVTEAVDIARWIANEYQKRKESRQFNETQDNEPQNDERMDDCLLKTLHTLRQESDRKKLEHIKSFAQNTILSETAAIDPETILSFLMDIERMTWRQICFIEGFNRRVDDVIEIIGIQYVGTNGQLRYSEMKTLVNLNYFYLDNDNDVFHAKEEGLLDTDEIKIRGPGKDLARLMDLKSIAIDEIGRAFGVGMIRTTL